jgi:hypothetical protein
MSATDEPGTVVFILSSTRSGSTWLALMLGSHSRACYAGELSKMFSSRRAACALCEERGVHCPVFDDAVAVGSKRIHQRALERTAKSILIDNSKSLAWAERHLAGDALQRKYVHLLRDPRAVVHAWQTHGRAKGIEDWVQENDAIGSYIADHRLDHHVVTYDQLAAATGATLRPLCSWLGLDYEAGQVEYWRFEHHGAGRNGATAAFLESYVAPDREFYAANRRRPFRDRRWREQLDAQTRASIEQNERLGDFLASYGLRLDGRGLLPVEVLARGQA